MTLMPRFDPEAEAEARYNRYGLYPNGNKTWKQFLASMQLDKECYFALRLMEDPKPFGCSRLHFGTFSNERFDPLVFGVLTKRKDGKIGRLCFAQADVFEKEPKTIYVLLDGLSKKDLRLAPETFMEAADYSHPWRRISALYTERSDVEKALVEWLERRIGQADRWSHSIQELRLILQQFFPERSAVSPQIAEFLERLDTRVVRRIARLEKMIEVSQVSIEKRRKEIASLQ